MSKTLVLRYSKEDDYDNNIFVASNLSDKPEMKASFSTLKQYYEKLQSMELGSFLPIYCKEDFSSIRFKKNYKHKNFTPGNIYEITYEIRIVEREGKKYCNCHILNTKLATRAEPVDKGELFTL